MARSSPFAAALVLGAGLAAGGCSRPEPPRPSFIEAEDHAHYAAALNEFGLDKTALGRDWLLAADRALAQPVVVALPFEESEYIAPTTPAALGYEFTLQRGRTLAIDVRFDAEEPSRLFVELFETAEGEAPRRVAETRTDAAGRLEYEARRSGVHLLRIQPELLRGGRVVVSQRTLASLGFPVQGLSLRAVQSVFGDPRDGGIRDHHGVDIFAPRGTPVLAAVDGTVRVDTGNRGGQLIWLQDATAPATTGRRRGRRLYYAHLDDWAVANGDRVRAGDVIGYVGNTGNARTTAPHLHFGVYDRGPVDPTPFLMPDDPAPAGPTGALELLGAWARVTRSGAVLREAPNARAVVVSELDRDMVARVQAATGAFYRVTLPDGVRGYISAREVAVAGPMGAAEVESRQLMRASPSATGPVIEAFETMTTVDVLGRFGAFRFVRLPDARTGWIETPADRPRPGA
jgi:murein DD-endopeptidase MepM/ murein hydrolase activator NlpD